MAPDKSASARVRLSLPEHPSGNLLLLENPILCLFPGDWRRPKGTIRCRLRAEKAVGE
jgi:hypothetical protein